MEQILNDQLGNVITLRYDASTNVVSVNDNSMDSIFHEITACNESEEKVICMDGLNDWDSWSDVETRWKVGEFFWENKVI